MKIIKSLALVLVLLAAVSCMVPTTIVYQLDSDVSLKDSWKASISQNPTAKIVLRVPGYSKEITQAEMTTYESLYNDIERKLLQAQFTVRDRSLLREVLTRAGGELSYSEIGKKVDTDIILEIVSFQKGTLTGTTFTEGSAVPPTPVDVFGAVLEGRIILVASGEVVGMFTIREIHPHPEYWIRPEGSRTYAVDVTEADIDAMKSAITKKLADLLKGLDVPPSRITRVGYAAAGSSGWGRSK
ncbi:MAG: hypothetical protein NTZ26_13925 [Candidatus Aminicenantes bacterium]|nr:hypothetical protein [Candidatus Aminicenantes bacterium]